MPNPFAPPETDTPSDAPTGAPADPIALPPEPAVMVAPERDPVYLPANARYRHALHNEVHARPPARIRMPALVVYVAVLNTGVSRAAECAHLQRLPGLQHLSEADLSNHFVRLRHADHSIKWESHNEFSHYTICQPLAPGTGLHSSDTELLASLSLSPDWLGNIPGQTMAAIQLLMLHADLDDVATNMATARTWLGERLTVASVMGNNGHSWALTDFALRDSGFERMLVLAPEGTTDTRAGRIAQRLLELETYRLMALRGLPVAKQLMPMLTATERELADITGQIERGSESDPQLLNHLATLAARVEQAIASHAYRFAASSAYHGIVSQRIAELRERAIPGTTTIGEFMNRRLSPAMATVSATANRLSSLSERITRATALLRTRVDIATETQNQLLLEKLTKGQDLQLRLQSTVEGLSIAAISYYVVSLLLYVGKAGKAMGLPIHPEMAAGAAIPLVLWAVWRTTRRIHEKLHAEH